MLMEAVKSGNFERFAILEVNEKLVAEIRSNGNSIVINTATNSGIIKFHISNLEIQLSVTFLFLRVAFQLLVAF